MVSKAVEKEIARQAYEQAVYDARSRAASLESGRIPSGLYKGARVEIMRSQDHFQVGRRYAIHTPGAWFWVLADEISEVRGTVPEMTPKERAAMADYAARLAREQTG